ncbi:class I SAM-dependent methyltransferase [Bradyrhizobium liaoningense]|uniref:class I SAM-dependent methyltransferase n=1 Tax=Bradyrhizobium liaoningense TaxID=43992 RepID=UPI001BA95CB7|nr:class I SAM-dependent methyltransferase [Bradyrhizobium liaoningense]MBR0843865.1 class I SAM-dependent methyltransferase [Bradyrhizobium liaoningense]
MDGAFDASGVSRGMLVCAGCGARFDKVWGVPFLGNYGSSEILGLIEIAANIENRGRFGVTPAVVEQWERVLERYHAAADKTAFIRSEPAAQSPFLANRYGEWVEIAALTKDLDMRGWRVLDLGAGLGFDAHRLSLKGATVTALEFSPLLAEWGAANFPAIRWIGGLSDALPFRAGSFDAVFCNAALHHMRDIPAVFQEALRVLRPGGVLITTCDSFRSDAADELWEARIFDRDPAVLQGVNERVPRFTEFASTLERYREHLKIEVYTHTLFDAPTGKGKSTTLTCFTPWDFEHERAMLAARGGSLAFKIVLERPIDLSPRLQSDDMLAPADFAEMLHDQPTALAHLAALVPKPYVNLPFPGRDGAWSKFELLNGWRLAGARAGSRRAYKRGRWFLSRSPEQTSLSFEVRVPSQGRTLTILLDGKSTATIMGEAGRWVPVRIDLLSCNPGVTFAVEIRMEGGGDDIEAASFEVQNRRLETGQGASTDGTLLSRLTGRLVGWLAPSTSPLRLQP